MGLLKNGRFLATPMVLKFGLQNLHILMSSYTVPYIPEIAPAVPEIQVPILVWPDRFYLWWH